MIKYEDILFFRDQHIVDELYQKLKTDNDNEELEKAYELYKKNQYGKYLKDVLEGKYID